MARSGSQRRRQSTGVQERPSRLAAALGVSTEEEVHDQQLVDHLDVIDGHVSVVSTLTNTANSILIPPLPFYNRTPTVDLQAITRDDAMSPSLEATTSQECLEKPSADHEIDQHVAEVLGHRATLRRQLSGLWAFLKTPTGAVMGIYGFLVAFWGAAIVLFLGKLINLHNKEKQDIWVEISCQVENALFTITGVGLIPWRVIDTYRIVRIWHYQRVIRKRREQRGLPPLCDENDLPDPVLEPNHVHVLEARQQEQLQKQQEKFQKSQTWYRPHRTDTHKAFPIGTALWICLLTDGNSVFQCMLCGCMWGLNRFDRPAWTTGTLVPASFLCGIAAGVLIWYGGKQTRKTLEVEERLRRALERSEATAVETASIRELREAYEKEQLEKANAPALAPQAEADYDEEAAIGARLVHTAPPSAVSLPEPQPGTSADKHDAAR
ncbi:hypothetical protein EXIGLDRAFT_599427 [Exidia glandulosa HHB12029]|uniref:Transmembrane protein n=1 Tax=Exidia glandulosa HHB12029 TaxID=1314781 RepID=A0A165QKV8_EXIGL|nr:hypothetical protein EXIGLDRAFT_599427 [Exidia glandulosa HHB12029]